MIIVKLSKRTVNLNANCCRFTILKLREEIKYQLGETPCEVDPIP